MQTKSLPQVFVLSAVLTRQPGVRLELRNHIGYRVSTDSEAGVVSRFTQQALAANPGFILATDVSTVIIKPAHLAHVAATHDPLSIQILAGFDAVPLECDGMSLLLHKYLLHCGITHTVVRGRLRRTDGKKPGEWRITDTLTLPAQDNTFHVWIRLNNQHLLDLRARMWFGDDAPHGVFDPSEFPDFEYSSH